MKKEIAKFGLIPLLIGIGVGLVWLSHYYACRIKIGLKPLVAEWDCSAAFGQVPINFGESPSEWTLKEALTIVEERTQRRGRARVYIDKAVFSLTVIQKKVAPPAGTHPSIELIHQLIASANASDKIHVCLIPGGGYRVCSWGGGT